MREREVLAWILAAAFALFSLLMICGMQMMEVSRDKTLAHVELADDKVEIMELRLAACEERYLAREKQADTCWATLAEVLP